MLPFYEYADVPYQINKNTSLSFPPHLHAGVEILYVRKGSVEVQYENQVLTINPGEVLVFFPNVVHAYISTAKDSLFSMYIYRGKLCKEIDNIFLTKEPTNLLIKNLSKEVKFILDALHAPESETNTPFVITLYFQLLLAKLFPKMDLKKRQDNLPEDLLISVLSYIEQNFEQPIFLENLAKEFGVSRYKISRLFTHNIKISLNDYINTLRIEKAKSLLKNPNISIIEVAFNCGFESQQTFNRVFKKTVNMTPKDYRKT